VIVIAAKGPVKVAELLQQAQAEEAGVPALALDMLGLLGRFIAPVGFRGVWDHNTFARAVEYVLIRNAL
jgi:hypothetical protein